VADAQARQTGSAPAWPWHAQADVGQQSSPAETTAPGDVEQPWNELSAEALTRACETAEAELRNCPPPRRHAREDARTQGGAASAYRNQSIDPASLEQRLCAFASTLDKWREQIDPEKSLAAFHQHLTQFERRLEDALASLARCGDASAMLVIEAQVGELNAELAATRKELGRLEAIDGRLNALSQLLSARQQHDAVENPTQPAADPAVSQLASPPPATAGPHRRGEDIISSLEQLLQRCIAERRGDAERSATVLQGIDDALARIVERIAIIEEAKAGSGDLDESDDLYIESDRLADAYAAGARALGQDPFPFALDAADYASTGAGAKQGTASQTAGAGEAGARPGRKQRAHAAEAREAPAGDPSPVRASAELAAAMAGIEDFLPEAPASEGRRLKRVLSTALALLFASGYLTGDGLSARTSGARAMTVTTAPSLAGATSLRPSRVQPLPAAASLLKPAAATQHVALGALDAPQRQLVGPELPAEIGSSALRRAAVAGDPAAQFEIASRFLEGKGVAEDRAKAVLWFQRAAMRGHGPSQFQLGLCFERGSGVAIDAERAKAWYHRAAEQGVVRAMHNLAVLTIGPDQAAGDYAAAARWFGEAAARGLIDSQFNLAVLYENGLGVARNLQTAYQWYALAARAGDKEAAHRLERINPQLAPDQLLAAERQLSAWRARAEH
jgi:localization factor PodJL